ncbi:MAG: tetratricopeptide repeat protein [Saprospiraceae bacterium]|nr:tetratricopeptide repeat protein [Saprospiraceae bacterium]
MSKKKKNSKKTKQIQTKVQSNRPAYLIILILTFILYGNTIPNDFALDDIYSISGNQYTKKGFEGINDLLTKNYFSGFYGDMDIELAGGRYRPLSLVTFAIEYEIFGENPHINHFINVLLFALTGILIYLILLNILKRYKSKEWWFSIPFIATLLFVFHPIHTEVVANIKGRDEILSLLGALLSLWLIWKYIETKKSRNLYLAFITFFLALMSKENAATFLLIIPLTIYYFSTKKLKNYLKIFIPLVLATVAFFWIRFSIVGGIGGSDPTELMDNPFLNASFIVKYATIFYTFAIYLKLLIFPHPLTWDYYPYHIELVEAGNIITILSFVFFLAIGVYAILTIKKKSIWSFCILFFLISFSIVSNLVFSIGAFMAERFMYIPSLAFCILIAFVLVETSSKIFKNYKTHKKAVLFFISIVFLLFSIKTISRNTTWKDDFTLYTHDVNISKNSAKSNNIAGQHYAYRANQTKNQVERNENFRKAISLLRKSIEIHPKYMDALFYLGNVYFDYNKNLDSTFYYYFKILEIDSAEKHVFENTQKILNTSQDIDFKIKIYSKLFEFNKGDYNVNYSLGSLLGEHKSNLDTAIFFMKNAIEINPKKADAYKFLGTVYYLKNDFKNAVEIFEKAVELDPNDERMKQYLGAAKQIEVPKVN